MRKVVGLIAFCCMVSSTGYISYADAARSFNQMRMKELEKDPKIKEYLKLAEKENNFDVQEENGNEELNSETKSVDSVPKNTKKKKKKKKKNKKNQSVQSSANDSMAYGESDNQTMDGDQNYNQTSGSKKKKKKKKKNKKNRSVQNSANDSMTYDQSDNQMVNNGQNFGQTSGNKKKRKKKKNKKNRANQMNQMGRMDQMNMMNQNQGNPMGQMNQMGQMNMMNQNQGNSMGQMNMMNQNQGNPMNQMNQMVPMGQMDSIDSDDVFVLNEPIVDGTKIKESTMVVEKDIKLASDNETKKIEKKVSPINLSPLDKEKVLAHLDSEKDVKLAANFNDSDLKIKEKLQQVDNDRKTYNLIRTPDKTLKDNIQVNKFRAELDHYRKLYSANSKNA